MKIERSIEVAAPPEEVWRILQVPEKWMEWSYCWAPFVRKIEGVSRGAIEVGSVLKVTAPFWSLFLYVSPRFKVTINEAVPNRRLVYTAKYLGFTDVHSVNLEAVGTGTRVTAGDDERGFLGLLVNPFFALFALFPPLRRVGTERDVDKALARLKQKVEAMTATV